MPKFAVWLIDLSLVGQVILVLSVLSDAGWAAISVLTSAAIGAFVKIAMKRMEIRQEEREAATIKVLGEVKNETNEKLKDIVVLKAIAVETKGLVNHGALVNLEFIEGLTKRIAESGNPQDIEAWHRAEKAVIDHREIQAKLDVDAKQVKDDARQASTDAVKIAEAGVKVGGGESSVEGKVDDVKETVEVIDHNVKAVKGEVLKDVVGAVKQGVQEAKKEPK